MNEVMKALSGEKVFEDLDAQRLMLKYSYPRHKKPSGFSLHLDWAVRPVAYACGVRSNT